MRIRVINLATSTARRERIEAELTRVGLKAEIFPAIDGRKVPHPLFARYDERRCLRYRRSGLSGGELGCWASHVLLWEDCVASGEPLVVLEDDIALDDRLPEALALLEPRMEGLGYVRLAGIFPAPTFERGRIGPWTLHEYRGKGPTGTQGYVLHPRSAAILLEHASTWWLAVDDFMDRPWRSGVPNLCLVPHTLIIPGGDGDIVRLPRRAGTPWRALVRKVLRSLERGRRWRYGRARLRVTVPFA